MTTPLQVYARITELEKRNEQLTREVEARANILNRAVRHRQALFPNDVGNGWIDSIDCMAHEIPTLRGRLAAKERELEVARLAHKAADKDRQDALDMLDKAGVWTGFDMLVSDRLASLIRVFEDQQRKIVTLQADNGHLETENARLLALLRANEDYASEGYVRFESREDYHRAIGED